MISITQERAGSLTVKLFWPYFKRIKEQITHEKVKPRM
jgi:hypothetical protein